MSGCIDLTNRTFGFLTVENRAANHVSKGGNSFVAWNCRCVCGRNKVVTAGHLTTLHTTSCGQCGAYDHSVDMTGRVVGLLTVVGKADTWYQYPNGDRDFHWNCECECGNHVVVRGNTLRDGINRNRLCSCGCVKRFKRITDDDMVGRQFGRLSVVERAEDYVGSDGKSVSQWLCECKCGNVVKVRGASLRNGHTASCGCYRFMMMSMNGNAMSKSELWTAEFLDSIGMVYEQQKSFPGLVGVGGNLLGYDFYVPSFGRNGLLIECQGLQHYEPVTYFGGEAVFERQKEHDARKISYAKSNGIEFYAMNVVKKLRADVFRELSALFDGT